MPYWDHVRSHRRRGGFLRVYDGLLSNEGADPLKLLPVASLRDVTILSFSIRSFKVLSLYIKKRYG